MAGSSSDDKYLTKDLSDDPADYLTGPRGGEANRTHGGTTQEGNSVQLLRVENAGAAGKDTSDK